MPDNVTVKDAANADVTIAADEVTRNATSEKQQIFKISLGADGVFDTLVDSGQQTMANSIPVAIASDQTYQTGTSARQIQGAIAHDSPESTIYPLEIGASASTGLGAETMVANNDITHLHAGTDGILFVRPHGPLEDIVSNRTSTTGATSTSLLAANTTCKQYLMAVSFVNTSNTGIYVDVLDASTIKWTLPVPPNGGVVFNFPIPLVQSAVNQAWNFQASSGVTTLYASAVAFKSKI